MTRSPYKKKNTSRRPPPDDSIERKRIYSYGSQLGRNLTSTTRSPLPKCKNRAVLAETLRSTLRVSVHVSTTSCDSCTASD